MNNHWLERTELLIKQQGINTLQKAHILIVGLGGVGSFAAEFIARAGVGALTIVDGDCVSLSNINRQLPALHSTVGKNKTDVMAARLLDINPQLNLTVLHEFLTPERATEIVTPQFDYVIDCIDSITPKLNLILSAKRQRVRLVSCMGAGGATDVSQIKVADLMKTYNCPLAKFIRKRLKNERIRERVLTQNTDSETLDDLNPLDVFECCLAAHHIPADQRDALRQNYREILAGLDDDRPQ